MSSILYFSGVIVVAVVTWLLLELAWRQVPWILRAAIAAVLALIWPFALLSVAVTICLLVIQRCKLPRKP